jgi:hypothetical protein
MMAVDYTLHHYNVAIHAFGFHEPGHKAAAIYLSDTNPSKRAVVVSFLFRGQHCKWTLNRLSSLRA